MATMNETTIAGNLELAKFKDEYEKHAKKMRTKFVNEEISMARYAFECSSPIHNFVKENKLKEKECWELDNLMCEYLFPSVLEKKP